MKYYYSLLEGLVLIFNLDHNEEWSRKLIDAKRDFKRKKDVHIILDLFGGKGYLNDNVVTLDNEELQDLGQAWFESLCAFTLKASDILLDKEELTYFDIKHIAKEEEKNIMHSKKISGKYSKEDTKYYDTKLEVNRYIVEGLDTNNIERSIKKSMNIR